MSYTIDEMEAVATVLVDTLHTTDDDELQAGLYQLLEYAGDMEGRLATLRTVLRA